MWKLRRMRDLYLLIKSHTLLHMVLVDSPKLQRGASADTNSRNFASGFNPALYGEAGIGMKDLTALRNQGFNKDQIAAYVGSEREKGTAIGERVDASLGMMHQQSTKEGAIKDSGFDPKQYGQAGFGFEDIKELARQGYGKDQISAYVDQGGRTHRTGPAQTKSVAEMGFDPGAYGERGIGQKDLTELRNRGFNREQISQYVEQERAKGRQLVGELALLWT